MDELRDLVRGHEGFKQRVYPDPIHGWKVPSVGVGFNLTRDDAAQRLREVGADLKKVLSGEQVLTPPQIQKLFDYDLNHSLEDARSIFPGFDAFPTSAKKAIVDMIYNLGRKKFLGFKNMIDAVRANDWQEAAYQMFDSKWFDQVGKRAENDFDLMNDSDNASPESSDDSSSEDWDDGGWYVPEDSGPVVVPPPPPLVLNPNIPTGPPNWDGAAPGNYD